MARMITATAENVKDIGYGARVRLHPAYATGTKYFVCPLATGFCLIADSKRDLRNDTGHIYSVYDIKSFEVLDAVMA